MHLFGYKTGQTSCGTAPQTHGIQVPQVACPEEALCSHTSNSRHRDSENQGMVRVAKHVDGPKVHGLAQGNKISKIPWVLLPPNPTSSRQLSKPARRTPQQLWPATAVAPKIDDPATSGWQKSTDSSNEPTKESDTNTRSKMASSKAQRRNQMRRRA